MPSFPSAGRMVGVGRDVVSDGDDGSNVEDKRFSSLPRSVGRSPVRAIE